METETFKNTGINNLGERGGREVGSAQIAAEHYWETRKETEIGGSRN